MIESNRSVKTSLLRGHDTEFRAEAKKSNLDISPLSGEEVAKTLENIFKIEPTIAAKLKQILLPK